MEHDWNSRGRAIVEINKMPDDVYSNTCISRGTLWQQGRQLATFYTPGDDPECATSTVTGGVNACHTSTMQLTT